MTKKLNIFETKMLLEAIQQYKEVFGHLNIEAIERITGISSEDIKEFLNKLNIKYED